MSPLISVILPVYNRKDLIKKALKSVISQIFNNIEIIVIDDCSTDGITECDILSMDKRILYYRQPFHCGVSKARNDGVKLSKGEWIAFIDSDDEWLRQKLEKQIKWTLSHKEYEIVQTKEIWIRDGKRVNAPATHEKFQGDLFSAGLDRCMITPSSVLLTRSLFDRAGGFNESLPACEDYDLWLRICSNNPVGLIDEYLLIRYGGHSDQLSANVMGLDRFRIRSILGLLERNQLSESQKLMAITTLIKKATVVANGYLKRGNTELYERFISIVKRFDHE
jgi:glycosyltransferase involved in cell wall biosynthesis